MRPLDYDDLYRIPLPSDPQLAPDGVRVAYVRTTADRETDGYRSEVWLAGAAAPPRRLTAGPADGGPRWSPDGRTLAFLARRDGVAQLCLLPLDGGEARELTKLPGGVAEACWSPDGTALAVLGVVDLAGEADEEEATRRRQAPLAVDSLDAKADGAGLLGTRRQHLFVVPVEQGVVRQLTFGDYSVGSPAWSPDGTRLAFVASTAPDRDLRPAARVFVVPADGGVPVPLTDQDAVLDWVAWTPGGEALLVAGQRRLAVGHSGLFRVPATGGALVDAVQCDRNVMLGAPGYPGGRPQPLPDGRVLFCARDRGCTHVYQGAPDRPAEKIIEGDDRVVAGTTWAAGKVAFVAATPDSPGEVYLAADDGSAQQRVTSLFADALPDVELVPPRPRTFTAPDGTEIHGWVLRADGQRGPTPLLLDVHGGPHNAWGPAADTYHLYHQTLAAAGWTILYVNPRGSDGYGADFYRAVAEEWGTADQGDFLAAVDALVADGLADQARLAVTGYSYGGFTTCWLTTQTDRFAAAVAGGCVSDLASLYGTSDYGRILGLLEVGGEPADRPAAYAQHSPITHVSAVGTPTLVLHGERDDRCPIGQAEQWFTALRSRGVPTELVRYPEASHLFIISGRPSHRIDYCRRVADWVRGHTEPAGRPARPLRRRLLGLQQALEQLARQHNVPGACVGVLHGEDVEVYATGVANLDTGAPVTTDTAFQIGSNTKLFTATLVMQLVDQGQVDLDAPVRHYLPELRLADETVAAAVTVRQLLTHTSGIDGDYFGPDQEFGDDAISRFVDSLHQIGQVHPLGELWSYCNVGWVVLGALVEKVTGLTYDRVLRTRLLDPLGLRHTGQRPAELIGRRLAAGHLPLGPDGALQVAPAYCISPGSAPAGSLLSAAAADVLAFVRLHLDEGRTPDGHDLLSPSAVKAMQTRQVDIPVRGRRDGWGLGWSLGTIDGERLIGHGGGTLGHLSTLEVLPDRRLAVVVLTNAPGGAALGQALVGHVFDRLADLRLVDPDATAPVVELDLQPYVGTYRGRATSVEVSLDGDRLKASVAAEQVVAEIPAPPQTWTLLPVGVDRFRVEGSHPLLTVHFLRSAPDGEPDYVFAGRVYPRVRPASDGE